MAVDSGISFDLDISVTPEETKARVAVRSTATLPVDEQRYMKATISSDDESEYVDTIMLCIETFIDQIISSPVYTSNK